MALLWLTTVIPQARPPPCYQPSSICISPTTLQLILLCSSFSLMSIGAGGIRSSSLAFGADQLEQHDCRKNPRALEIYFSWYYVSTTFSIVVAITCIVYIQDNIGWGIGFGVPVVLMFLSAVFFFLASPFYVKLKAKSSLLTGMFQVILASYKNRHLELSSDAEYHFKKGSMLVIPTEKLRYIVKSSLQNMHSIMYSICVLFTGSKNIYCYVRDISVELFCFYFLLSLVGKHGKT